MKAIKVTFSAIVLAFLITSNVKSQVIDSLKIIPTNPTVYDTLKIVSYTFYPHSPCHKLNSSVSRFDSIIQVNASHYDSINAWMANCNSVDTLALGKFGAGSYELIYNLLSDTAPTYIYDKDTIIFTVKEFSGIPVYGNMDQGVDIFPNPTAHEIFIEFKKLHKAKYTIELYSSIGQNIKTLSDNRELISMDISDLRNGIYLIVVTIENEKYLTRKIIKNAP